MERHEARVEGMRAVLEDHGLDTSLAASLALRDRRTLASALPGAHPDVIADLEDAHDEAERREGFLMKAIKFPFRHPIITALGAGAAAFLAPVIVSGAWSRMEAGGVRTVMDRVMRFFRPGQVFATPAPPAPALEVTPPGGFV